MEGAALQLRTDKDSEGGFQNAGAPPVPRLDGFFHRQTGSCDCSPLAAGGRSVMRIFRRPMRGQRERWHAAATGAEAAERRAFAGRGLAVRVAMRPAQTACGPQVDAILATWSGKTC